MKFLLILFVAVNASADCNRKIMDACVKMNLVSAKFSFISSLLRFRPMCDVEFEEVVSKKRWTALVRHCPDMSGPQYAYILFSCYDPNGGLVNDSLEVWENGECVSNPGKISEAAKTIEKLKRLPTGTGISEVKKMGFYRTEVKENIWIYHGHPGYSAEIEVNDMKCENGPCSSEEGRTIKKIIDVKLDFIH